MFDIIKKNKKFNPWDYLTYYEIQQSIEKNKYSILSICCFIVLSVVGKKNSLPLPSSYTTYEDIAKFLLNQKSIDFNVIEVEKTSGESDKLSNDCRVVATKVRQCLSSEWTRELIVAFITEISSFVNQCKSISQEIGVADWKKDYETKLVNIFELLEKFVNGNYY